MKKLVALAAAFSLTAALFANGAKEAAPAPAGGSSAAPAASEYADSFVMGKNGEPECIDPNGPGVGGAEVGVTQQIYEGLVTVDENGAVEPLLATDWTISGDGLTYTFNLRPGVVFSDGTPVTGEDWEFSLIRARDYKPSGYRFIAEEIKDVQATDTQVVITLKEPCAPFLFDLANFNMIVYSKAHYDKVGDEGLLTQPLGTGPYKLESWNRGQDLTLVANEHYWQPGYPKTPKVIYKFISDDNTRVMQLQSGQIDVINDLPASLTPPITANKNLTLTVFDSTQIRYLILNTTKPPFDDVNVRRALYYALDKQELCDALSGGYGQPVGAIVSPTEGKWCNTDIPVEKYDPEKAKQALRDAGYTEPVKFSICVNTGSALYQEIATLIKSEVDKAGFDCTIELLESAALRDRYSSLSHEATVLMWIDDIRDPSEITGWAVDYDQCNAWYTGLNDVDLDNLNAAAFKEQDEEKRVQMYHEIQQRIYDNANIIPLFSQGFAYAYSNKMQDVHCDPFGRYELKEWTKLK